MFVEYPKWIDVDGAGHPQNKGRVLVENADQERAALATGKGPDHLNPGQSDNATDTVRADLTDLADKSIGDMNREELIATLVAVSITDEVTDDDLRDLIDRAREARSGNHDDEELHPEPIVDAAGEKAPPPQDQEANKDQLGASEVRTQPLPEAAPGTDARSDDAKAREPASAPASDPVAQAQTAPDEKKPPEEGGTKAKASAAKK
jgi:hypothetical protein